MAEMKFYTEVLYGKTKSCSRKQNCSAAQTGLVGILGGWRLVTHRAEIVYGYRNEYAHSNLVSCVAIGRFS